MHPGAKDVPGDKVDQDCHGGDARFTRFSPPTVARWNNFAHLLGVHRARGPQGAGRDARRAVLQGPRLPLLQVAHHREEGAPKRLKLTKRLKGSHLGRGSRLELRLIRKDQIGALLRWNVGPPPVQVVRCLVPGKSKERKC